MDDAQCFDAKRFGVMVRAARVQRGFTLRDVSPMLGFSISHLSQIERGETILSLEFGIRLARFYGISLDAFVLSENANEAHARALLAESVALLREARDVTGRALWAASLGARNLGIAIDEGAILQSDGVAQ